MKRLSASKYQTVHEYSLSNFVSEELVRRFCRTGRLEAIKIKNKWVIARNEKIAGYEPRLKAGVYVGLNDLKKGDIQTFLKKRGYYQE